jgi:hypothetical protein
VLLDIRPVDMPEERRKDLKGSDRRGDQPFEAKDRAL